MSAKCTHCEGDSYLPGPPSAPDMCWACLSEQTYQIYLDAQEQIELFNVAEGVEEPFEAETSSEPVECFSCKNSIPKWFGSIHQGHCLECLGVCGCGAVVPLEILELKGGSCVNCDIKRFAMERALDESDTKGPPSD